MYVRIERAHVDHVTRNYVCCLLGTTVYPQLVDYTQYRMLNYRLTIMHGLSTTAVSLAFGLDWR
jgi:hypothetical protein